jgi:hypothetical protein
MFKFFRAPKTATTSPNFYISDKAATKTVEWLTTEGQREVAALRDAERAAWILRQG